MRKTSTLEAGDYARRYATATTFLPQQQVSVRARYEAADGEDRFIITSMTDSREFVVEGDCLKPHPDDRETNVEFVTRVMEFSRCGALQQVFVLTALEKYAQLVKQMPQNQRDSMDEGMISFGAWEKCADEVLSMLDDRAKED